MYSPFFTCKWKVDLIKFISIAHFSDKAAQSASHHENTKMQSHKNLAVNS